MQKRRVDELLVERGFFDSRAEAAAAIMAGEVRYNRPDMKTVQTAGEQAQPDAQFLLRSKKSKYVSRGGDKLASALAAFNLDLKGLKIIDAGASSGGFTDCALQAGAAQVSAVDVAYGQFAYLLRDDARVKLYERTNIRDFARLEPEERFDLLVADLSFVPLASLIDALVAPLKPKGCLLLLIKPQFELDASEVADGGVVVGVELHKKALMKAARALENAGFGQLNFAYSGLKGAKGNTEFFVLASRGEQCVNEDLEAAVDALLKEGSS